MFLFGMAASRTSSVMTPCAVYLWLLQDLGMPLQEVAE